MQRLRVGELARRTGLTVRTLHHYDEIGLLRPSTRSESGYRLYSEADVQRLHAIQTLRHLGLPLGDIAGLLQGGGPDPESIIGQQIQALDRQIAQATELRGRLSLLRNGLVAGPAPGMRDWLETLGLMGTYGKYFSAAELQRIFGNWKRIEADWTVVRDLVRGAMDRGLPPHDPEVQRLAYRWMALMMHWMDGDLDLLNRWGHMFRTEPGTQGRNHAPSGDMIAYIESAIQLRMSLLSRYVDLQDLRRLGHVPYTDWAALDAEVQALIARQVPASSGEALAACRRWNALFDTLTRQDAELRRRLLAASASEPLLRAGTPLSEAARTYLESAQAFTQRPAKSA
ncbi:MerR family transcriptional regulator [Paracidovorax cattleyae]|uniref:MerR family transcriptional regulator n=1 Tax=Paracidovorax cattleyae TaxID=80868 RepID=UPI000B87C687|nr:MerR family transcriptional regulator [Paracidovorax cattleyae]AVS76364.1 MerR family DNA-binding transcriptional regulator [Paracidovorax cattleyae]